MNVKGLLQVLARPWLMEESQALYWSDIAQQILVSKTMDAIPGRDPRTIRGLINAGTLEDAYSEFFRVDENGTMVKDGPVQVIQLLGPLMEEDYCGSPGMQTMQQAIRAANNDSTVQSIVLYHDSPGGSVAGTQNLSREIKKSKKPVVSFVNKMMCSADYWIGSSAKEIIADDEAGGFNSYIGSIGTVARFTDQTKADEQKGLRRVSVYATKSKRKGKYMEDLLSGDYTRLIKELDDINEIFLQSVQQNREGKLNLEKENVLEGEIYNGKEAVKWGLIDRMGSFQYAVKRSLDLSKSIK